MAFSTDYLLRNITLVRQKSRLLGKAIWIQFYLAFREHSDPFLQATVIL